MKTDGSILDVPRIPGDFGFTDEHDAARTEARRFLEERCPISEVRRLATDARGFERPLYRAMAELGWLGLTVDEKLGGLAVGSLHQALLLEEMGRVVLPSPYFASLMAIVAIDAAGSDAQRGALVPPIVKGDRIATLALSEPVSATEPGGVSVTAEPVSGGFVLRGTKTHVLFGDSADLAVVSARDVSGALALYAVELPSTGVTVEPESALDSTRRTARLTLDGVRVPLAARLEGDGADALRRTELRGAAFLASEMVGGIERTLSITRDYAASRIQFGRPIGAFQAVKHPIVDMMVGGELARSLALGAAVAFDHDPLHAEALARAAKVQAAETFLFAAKKGVQLHGGFGFTWDCDVHFYMKRALFSRALFGDPTHHRGVIAHALLG